MQIGGSSISSQLAIESRVQKAIDLTIQGKNSFWEIIPANTAKSSGSIMGECKDWQEQMENFYLSRLKSGDISSTHQGGYS
jgi:hypothetical protein